MHTIKNTSSLHLAELSDQEISNLVDALQAGSDNGYISELGKEYLSQMVWEDELRNFLNGLEVEESFEIHAAGFDSVSDWERFSHILTELANRGYVELEFVDGNSMAIGSRVS